MKKKYILNLIGVIFLILGITAIINTIYRNSKFDIGLAPILWFCYVGMILLGIGVLRKDSLLVLSQLNIIGIPLLFWNFDFFYRLLVGETFFGIVDYYFIPGPILGKIISSQHLFTIPLSLYVIFLIGLDRKDSWKISFFEMSVLFIVTRLFTTYNQNVNCVYRNCANFNIGLYYPFAWFIVMFILVYFTNYLVVKLYLRKNKKKKT